MLERETKVIHISDRGLSIESENDGQGGGVEVGEGVDLAWVVVSLNYAAASC